MIRTGDAYAGHEGDPNLDPRDFEFIAPVELPTGRYAYEVTYDHASFDAELAAVRRALLLVGGGGLVGRSRALLRPRRPQRHPPAPVGPRPGDPRRDDRPAEPARVPRRAPARHRGRGPLRRAARARGARHRRLQVPERPLRPPARRRGHQARRADPERPAAERPRLSRRRRRVRRCPAAHRPRGRRRADAAAGPPVRGRRRQGEHRRRVAAPGQSTADSLRAEADAALYEAKRRGGDQVVHYEEIREHRRRDDRGQEGGRPPHARRARPRRALPADLELETCDAARRRGARPADAELRPVRARRRRSTSPSRSDGCTSSTSSAPRQRSGRPSGCREVRALHQRLPATLDLDAEENDWLLVAVERAGFTPEQRRDRGHRALRRRGRVGRQVPAADEGAGIQDRARRCRHRQLRPRDAQRGRRRIPEARPRDRRGRRRRSRRARAVLLAMATFAARPAPS